MTASRLALTILFDVHGKTLRWAYKHQRSYIHDSKKGIQIIIFEFYKTITG